MSELYESLLMTNCQTSQNSQKKKVVTMDKVASNGAVGGGPVLTGVLDVMAPSRLE